MDSNVRLRRREGTVVIYDNGSVSYLGIYVNLNNQQLGVIQTELHLTEATLIKAEGVEVIYTDILNAIINNNRLAYLIIPEEMWFEEHYRNVSWYKNCIIDSEPIQWIARLLQWDKRKNKVTVTV